MPDMPRTENSRKAYSPSQKASAFILATAVFMTCLFGIYTRPMGFLAMFWPANAVMLGLLIRIPSAATPLGWIAGALAFMVADLLTGSVFLTALLLNGGNLVGIAAAYMVYMRCPTAKTGLRQPASMFYLLLAAAAGGAMAGGIGGLANPILFDGGVISGWTFWFATEFVNYIAILPVILAAPPPAAWPEAARNARVNITDLLPVVALITSFFTAALLGGPGAIAFPVPALLWCGLVYRVFPTALLTFIFSVWTLIVISSGYMPTQLNDEMAIISLRLGISLIAIAPIMLACVMESRNDLLKELHQLARNDPLTGVLNLKAFRDDAQGFLARNSGQCAILMFDLDHFKAINDTYGHAAGDKVLITFARRVRDCLRSQDILGRMGGDEFAAMLCNCSKNQVLAIVDRIRADVQLPVALDEEILPTVTISIGIALAALGPERIQIDDMLSNADAMLYRAKTAGRDRTEITVVRSDPPSSKQPRVSR